MGGGKLAEVVDDTGPDRHGDRSGALHGRLHHFDVFPLRVEFPVGNDEHARLDPIVQQSPVHFSTGDAPGVDIRHDQGHAAREQALEDSGNAGEEALPHFKHFRISRYGECFPDPFFSLHVSDLLILLPRHPQAPQEPSFSSGPQSGP